MHLRWLGTYVQANHDDRDEVVGQGTIDIVHDQDLIVTETRFGADVGLGLGFGVSVVVPVKVVSTTIRYLDDTGREVELANPGIHHRNETRTGLGDPVLLGSYGRTVSGWRVSGRVGVTVPLGRTEDDPFALGGLGQAHQHLQMGTGTFNPIIAAEVARGYGLWRFGGYALTQQTLYENSRGYHAGDRYAGALTASRRAGRWALRGGVEMQGETAEAWNGEVHTDEGNQGRIDVMLAGGASWSATEALTIDLGLKLPVVTHVVGGQLDMPAIVELGASWSFGRRAAVKEEEHHDHGDEHDHDHDEHAHDEHEHVDHDRAPAPVAGKITIVDYWATWCEPCKVLGPMLDEIAAANPEVVVLRVDVTDDDDWTIKLPYLEVFDAEGHEVLERSSDGDLDELVDAVKAAIAPAETRSIVVTEAGFVPADVRVPAGKPVRLVFRRDFAKTCATEIVLVVDGERIERALPLGETVTLDLTFPTPGKVTYACAMDMIGGTITVE